MIVMFDKDPTAKSDLKLGVIYAVAGENNWIYYGQICPDKSIGFFRRRDRTMAEVDDIVMSPIMAVVAVEYPSIGRALRNGQWKKLGRRDVVEQLSLPRMTVQWPVGTLRVSVWTDAYVSRETTVDDPAIQHMEMMAVWDAEFHIPQRLTADFGCEPAEWHVGGPIWRERKVKEEMAKRFADKPWHDLPPDWVATT